MGTSCFRFCATGRWRSVAPILTPNDFNFSAREDFDGSVIEAIISLTILPTSRKSGKSGVKGMSALQVRSINERTKSAESKNDVLSFWVKLVYGTGDWSEASYGTLRQIFYAIFLTDVVGLDARLASFAALVGIIWDAVNDPLVGILTDRMRSRWGRRRPFLLFFAIPFGASFLLLMVGSALAQPNRPGCHRHAGLHDQRHIRDPVRGSIFLPAARTYP